MLEPYGVGAAKISLDAIEALADRPRARYVVVTAITPTPLGEGKTTTTVGLGQGFGHINKKATIAIRQPSLGPDVRHQGRARPAAATARWCQWSCSTSTSPATCTP